MLGAASGSNPAGDFKPMPGHVSDFYAGGMVSAEVNSHYGISQPCNSSTRLTAIDGSTTDFSHPFVMTYKHDSPARASMP
jgi:hypothetical protein